MAKAMPEFITAYFGNETAIAAAMSVSPIDVAEAIKWSPSLIEQQEIAVNSIEALLLNQAISVALTSKNVTGCRWLLETMYPERYGKAKAAGPKGKGFTAPTDDPESLKSVLDKED